MINFCLCYPGYKSIKIHNCLTTLLIKQDCLENEYKKKTRFPSNSAPVALWAKFETGALIDYAGYTLASSHSSSHMMLNVNMSGS